MTGTIAGILAGLAGGAVLGTLICLPLLLQTRRWDRERAERAAWETWRIPRCDLREAWRDEIRRRAAGRWTE